MKQLVNEATHSKGYILDVVIVRDNTFIVPALPNVYDPCLCDTHGNSSGDHLAISFDVNASFDGSRLGCGKQQRFADCDR